MGDGKDSGLIQEIKLRKLDARPLFIQLKEGLRKQIQKKVPSAGTQIPSVDEIAKIQDISTWTVERALEELIEEKVLYRRPKSGTFIAPIEKELPELTKNIGFLLNERFSFRDEPFYFKMLIAAQRESVKHQYNLVFSTVDEKSQKETILPEFLVKKKVDGVIIAGRMEDKFILKLKGEKIPLVLIDYRMDEGESDCILIDNLRGAQEAVEHLVSLGHKKIGFIGGETGHPSIQERFMGYKMVMQNAHLNSQKFVEKSAPFLTVEAGYEAMRKMFKNGGFPTAVFCANDSVAIGVMEAIKERNLSVPKDISVIGFDDLQWGSYAKPPLSTVKVFKEKMGKLALRELLRLIRGKKKEPMETRVKTELIIRRSCGQNNS